MPAPADEETAGDRAVDGRGLVEPAAVEPWEVSEQLLIAGLREHELADQLRRQLAFHSAIMTSLAEGVYALDPTGRITFANPAAAQLLGWPAADLIGRDLQTILPVPDAHHAGVQAGAFPPVGLLDAGATGANDEARFVRKDGTTFAVAYSAAPIVIDGQVAGAVVSFRDMTEVQRLQQTQEEYVALLSHDLRSPLSVILAHARLLERRLAQSGHERELKSAEAVVESGEHMNRMIHDVLDRTLLESGDRPLGLGLVDLVQLVRRSVDQNVAPDERARIQIESTTPHVVVADPGLVERVIANLITNALKYSAGGSPVVVRVFRADQEMVIAVADQGVGIEADELPHVFDKHFRARTAGTTTGSGLGLYNIRLIMDAHGGRVWAESKVGRGSTFLVAFPAPDP